MSPEQLVALAGRARRRWPTADLVKNEVGNLAVLVDGEYVGWLDLVTGEANDV